MQQQRVGSSLYILNKTQFYKVDKGLNFYIVYATVSSDQVMWLGKRQSTSAGTEDNSAGTVYRQYDTHSHGSRSILSLLCLQLPSCPHPVTDSGAKQSDCLTIFHDAVRHIQGQLL